MAAKPADIQSLLECCICLGECQDPRILPCVHSLCRQCLENHIKSSARRGRYQCPACRHQCEVPAEGASGFPKNFFLTNLRDILEKQTGRQKQAANVAGKADQLECSNRDVGTTAHTSVTVYCVECSEHLCSNCEHFHRRLVGDSHELHPIGKLAASGGKNVKPRRRKPKCDQHPTLYNDMYCHTCHIPMCIQCCMVKHKKHEYCELADLTEESAENLSKLTQTAERRYTILDQHLKKLDVTKQKMDADADKACREVHHTADEFRDLVTKRERALISEIKDTHEVAATDLMAAYKETELNKASVQSLLSYIKALQASGDVSDQVVHTPGLQEQLRQHETSPLKSVSWSVNFERNTENKAHVNALLGSISKEQTVDIDRQASLADDQKRKLDPPFQTLTPKISNTCGGITKIGDCVCAVGWFEPRLWMHNLKSNQSKHHTITALEAVGMTTVGNNSNTLVITDKNKKLHFITINQQNMSITKQLTKGIPFEPRSVVYDHANDRLVIANKRDKQIVICNKNGDIQKRITVKPQFDGVMMSALPTDGDVYIVLTCIPGRVHWVNPSGDVTHTYGAGADEDLKYSWHMLQDSQGRLLVADGNNHCIRLINNQQFSHDLLTASDGIQHPSCVFLDETTGTLFVGHRVGTSYEVNMYKWPFASPAGQDTLSKQFKLCLNLGRFK